MLNQNIMPPGKNPGAACNLYRRSLGSPALGTSTAVHAAITDNGAQQVITTAITNPDVPRNVTATPGGTTGNVTAVQVVIAGTDANDQPITETLPAFTAAQATAVTGSKAFKTITSITIPSNGTSVTTAIGRGSKLGLPQVLSSDTIVSAYLNGVREGTRPTVAFDPVNLCSNTVTLNSALNGNPVLADYYEVF